MQLDLSIIIVNWNTCDLLRDCLASVYSKPCGVSFEVYVVDNASADGSVEMVAAEFGQVKLISNSENLGYACANNLAIRASSGRNVLLLNSDTVVDPDVLAETIELIETDSTIGSLGCRLVGLDGEVQNSFRFDYPSGPKAGGPDRVMAGGMVECAQVWGAYHLVRRRVIDQVGMLDEGFFMFYEDVDWCWRMHDADWKIVYDPKHTITHICRASCDRARDVDQQKMMIESEARLFAKHHAPGSYRKWRAKRLVHYGWCCGWYWLAGRLTRSKRMVAKFAKHSASLRAIAALADLRVVAPEARLARETASDSRADPREFYEKDYERSLEIAPIPEDDDFMYAQVLAQIRPHARPGLNVLDLGCSNGNLSLYMAQAGCRVLGIDLAQNAVDSARRSAAHYGVDAVRFERMDFAEEWTEPHTFDLVLCSHVLEHVVDDGAFLRRIAYATRPGGRLVLLTPSSYSSLAFVNRMLTGRYRFDEQVGHLRRYHRRRLTRLVEDAGFTVDRIVYLDGALRDWVVLFPPFRRFHRRLSRRRTRVVFNWLDTLLARVTFPATIGVHARRDEQAGQPR